MNTLTKKPKYKLIVSDFDGTLADGERKVSKENIEAVRAYTAAGGRFTIATGGMYPSIMRKLEEFDLIGDYPVASYDGSLVNNVKTGERLNVLPIKRSTVLNAVKYCEDRGIQCQFYTESHVYTAEYNALMKLYAEFTGVTDRVKVVGRLSDYLETDRDLELLKALIIADADKMDKIERDINDYFKGETVFFRSARILTECVDSRSGKGNYVKWAANYYGVGTEETVAVGDSANDVSMLKAAGLGVAMANAGEDVKRAAKFITDDCKAGGVAKLIYKILDGEL
jgi:Cof subfamily protein (haloacid dehalogenase superfamily)